MTSDPEVIRSRNMLIIEITQSLIAAFMIGAIVFNVITERPIPDPFENMVLLVVGFYFGRAAASKNGSNGK